MKLLDKQLTRQEIRNINDTLDGNICRLQVSDDVEEIMSSLGFAIDRLTMLAYNRVITLKERDK